MADAEESIHGTRGSEIIIVISGAEGHQRTCSSALFEDMLIRSFNIGEQQTRTCQLDDVVIDGTKDVLMELVKSQVRNFFRAQDVKPNEHKTSEEAAILVEIGATQVLEVFSLKYFAARAGDLGLRPPFVVDFCCTKPDGPRSPQPRRYDGSDWPTQPNEAYSLNQQVTRIDEDGSFFSTCFVETQLFKSKNAFGAEAMDI